MAAVEGSIPSRRCRHHGRRLSAGPGAVGPRHGGRKRPPDMRHRAAATRVPVRASPEGSAVDVPTWVWWTTIIVTDVGAALRRRRHRPAAARALDQGGLARAGALRRAGRRLRHRRSGSSPGHEYGRRVLRRLADRVLAVGRQPVHLHHHHGQVRGAPEVPAGGPDGRHRAGAGDARHLHRGRRRGDQQVQLGLLPVRPLPRLDGGQARQGGRERRRRVRGEPADQVGRDAPARPPTSGTASRSSPRRTASGWSPRCSS